MNVTQLAKHLGISKPTLYKRVKDAGLQLDDLRDKATGELTAQGAGVISALFDDKTPAPTEASKASQYKHLTQVDAEILVLRAQLAEAEKRIDLLTSILAAREAELQRMTTDLEAWRAKAQEVDVKQLLLTTAAATRRRGLFDAIRAAFGKNDE